MLVLGRRVVIRCKVMRIAVVVAAARTAVVVVMAMSRTAMAMTKKKKGGKQKSVTRMPRTQSTS